MSNTKLHAAMEQIKAILQQHDITGSIVLHTPGFTECFFHVDASFSCAKIKGSDMYLNAKLAADFEGDTKAWAKQVRDTTEMFHGFVVGTHRQHANCMDILTQIKHAVKVDLEQIQHSPYSNQPAY